MYVYSPVNHRPPRRRPWGALVIISILALFAFTAYRIDAPRLARAKEQTAAEARPALSDAQVSQMSASVNQVIANNTNMDIGVSIEDLNNGKQYNFGETAPFVAASTAKVITASLFLSRVESGQYSLNQTVGTQSAKSQLQAMIVNSDNDAWHAFNDLMGHVALLTYATQNGLSNYDPDKNTLAVSDITTLLAKVYSHKLLNKTDTDLLLGYMKQANENSYIVSDVPDGVTVYHKAGWLEDRVHDAAIIDNGKHPYVLTIFTKTYNNVAYPGDQGHQIFKDITDTTTQTFM